MIVLLISRRAKAQPPEYIAYFGDYNFSVSQISGKLSIYGLARNKDGANLMTSKPTYAELEAKVKKLESKCSKIEENDKRIIRALSESFEQLADRSQDAIYQFDIESGTFPFFNRRFLDLYGIEKKAKAILSSYSVLKHIHPDDIEKVKSARSLSLEPGGGPGDVEYRYLHTDGSTRWMHDRWSVIRDDLDQAVAIEGFIRDNTEKKQAEEELERCRNSALIGSYIIQNNRFSYVNPEFIRITGYAKDELIGMKSLDIVHEKYRDHVKKNAKRMLSGKRTTPYEFRVVDKNKRVKWVMETVTSVKFQGKRAAFGYFMDITRKKQVEEEKREKEKLQAILEMAGAISHELNSPLQVILTSSEKLDKNAHNDPLTEKLIKLIRKNTLRMVEISRKIQRISKYIAKNYVDGEKIVDIEAASKK